MQTFPNQQSPADIQALFSQFLAQLPPAQLAQLTPKSDGFPDIRTESRTHVTTAIAAHWTGRQEQTLRGWACYSGSGPLIPIRVHGKLMWAVADIRRLFGVSA